MKEQIINLETAKLAKEKGFDLKVIKHYKGDELIYNGSLYNFNNPEEQSQWNIELNSAPTQSLLQKWLREKNIIIEIGLDQTSYPKYCFNIYKYEDFGNWEDIKNPDWGLFSSYEKALEEALVLGLQNVSKTVA